MSWLSKVFGGNKGGFFGSGLFSPANLITGGAYGLAGSMFKKGPGTPLDKWIKPLTPGGKREAQDELDKQAADAAAAAEAKAHADEVNALGATAAETLLNRRRRGLYATILTGSGPTMGAPASSSGKSTLGA